MCPTEGDTRSKDFYQVRAEDVNPLLLEDWQYAIFST